MANTSELRMSRARLYVLIDGFEQDMRSVVERYLLDHQEENLLLTADEFSNAKRRQEVDPNGEDVSVIHYLDIQTCFDVMVRNKGELPYELTSELSLNAASFSQLVPIRHRVMHGRPLGSDDPSKTISLLSAFGSRHWQSTRQTLGRLKDDPTWEPYFEKLPAPFERTLHNLPEPDWDETTFIGRKAEAQKLLDSLRNRRNSVITVTGEGGIGKTALALDVAYTLVDSDENPYEAVLWVSLKTEKLTAYGVQELKDAIQGFDHTIVALGRGLDSTFSGSLTELASALTGIECLIIVDNLESAQGQEIVEMYDALPNSVNYLFTSRLGIGQLERRFPLPPLSEQEAKLLLRKFAVARQQKRLAGLSEVTITNVVQQLRNSPLAIRWYVLASEAGRVPLDTLRDQRELLDFCVKNVYDSLSENSKAVLTVLRALDRAIGFDEFAILTEMMIDELRVVTQELTRGSLVVVEAEAAGAIAGRLALTPTARSFLARPDHTGSFIAAVLLRERQFKASIEEGYSQKRMISPLRVRPRDANDYPAMYLLQMALTLAKSNKFAKAYEHLERAKSFNPEFSEVYRVSGYVRALEDHNETAVSEYQTALSYASDPPSIASASHALADVLARRLHNATLALPHARRAHESYPCGDTALLLGKVLIWTSQYKEGQEYLEEAQDSATGKHHFIISTVLIDSWARWADDEYKARNFRGAYEKAKTGFYSGQVLLSTPHHDNKLVNALAECTINCIRGWVKGDSVLSEHDHRLFQQISEFLHTHSSGISSRKKHYVHEALGTIQSLDRIPDLLKTEFNKSYALLSL
ncbi:ATP-binding protein [Arthrobacter sp. CC3]|uniref:tetratricopeptide repeat protein n=1 Tax=Arthrobacter sp. CC3 TaxID=3029185 RepID=UPI003264B311